MVVHGSKRWYLLAMTAAVAAAASARGVKADVIISDGWLLQDVAQVKDDGAAVSKAGYAPKVYAPKPYVKPEGRATGPTSPDWYKATVPGTVLTTLVNNNVYPEPMYGENNRPDVIPESLCRTSYWYRTEATVPADYAGKRTWLNFEGLNYTAEVWVNGKQVGEVKGAWKRGQFDITDIVKPGEKAAIAVKINPPVHPGTPLEQTVANGTGGNGGVLMQDGPTFGCTIGWDWIPGIRDRDMGIWQKVTFSSTGAVRVDDPSVSTDLPLPKTDSADLTLITTVRNATNAPVNGTLRGTYDGGTFAVPVTLAANETREVTVTPKEAAQLHINNPKLWWPNTYGEPNLYKMHVQFDVNGAPSDARDTNFGVRKITYAATAEQSLIPPTDNLTVFVNGVPVMCKGGCWGMDEALKRIPADVLDTKVRFHQLANYTMIRNWVGQSTSEDFYNACDKYGIMVWDEMFQANMSDGPQVGGVPNANDTPEVIAWRAATIKMYEDNVREKVIRFRSHPSIAIWCGRNESNPAPAEIANFLTQATHELDPARLFHANSNDGAGVRSGGPYSWRVPSAFFAPAGPPAGGAPNRGPAAPGAAPAAPGAKAPGLFDEFSLFDTAAPGAAGAAPAPGAAGGRAGRAGRAGGGGGGGRGFGGIEAFKTELGAVSVPTLEFIKTWMPEKDWYDLNDDWAEHDMLSGAQQGNTFPANMSARYGAIAQKDLPDFVRKSQMGMYETYRAMYEGRMAKLFNPCSAVLMWMSNPSQPSFVWQVYSYDLEPLAALYGSKKGSEPLHIQLNWNDFHVMAINTAPQAKEGLQARIRIFDMDGTQKSDKTIPVNAKACAATDLNAIEWPDGLSTVHFVKLELKDATGKLVSDNLYWHTSATLAPGTAPSPAETFGSGGAQGRGARGGGGGGRGGAPATVEDFSQLQAMPTAELQITLNRHDAGGKCLIDATITNPTKTPALNAHLQLKHSEKRDRVLPVFYSDNYISLLPGESKTITIEADLKNLNSDQPLVTLDGWNVTVADKTFPAGGGASVSLNKEAFVGPKTVAPARGGA